MLFTVKNLEFMKMIKYPNFEVQEGKCTFITGESGTGKSTLLKLLNGVEQPSEGAIFYKGIDIQTIDTFKLRQEILLVNQCVYLFDDTIRRNFDEFRNLKDQKKLTDAEMKMYLDLCAIDLNLDTICTTMSGGERQRIFIAICLSFEPMVLMLDEPTAALDDANANAIIANIKKYSKEKNFSLIIISHDQSIVEKYADNKIELREADKCERNC